MHLGLDVYLLALQGLVPPDQLVRLLHTHLVEQCQQCQREHAVEEDRREADLAGSTPLPPPRTAHLRGNTIPPLPENPRQIGARDLEARLPALERLRLRRDLDRRQLQMLLALPPDEWQAAVESTRSRYHSRSFAERLIEESRQRVRHQPHLACRLAALVPVVLRCIRGAEGTPWSDELRMRAAAWEANALRVTGELGAAAERFDHLDLESNLQERNWTAAEVASLLASLRIDQRRDDEALPLLRYSIEVFHELGDRQSAARSMLQKGNLYSSMLRSEEALDCYSRAAHLVEGEPKAASIRTALVAGRIYALCDLDRFDEARDLLASQQPLSEVAEPYLRAVFRYNRGRIAVGEGHPDEAVPDLTAARDHFLDTGRTYDAVLASLDLAYAHLQGGHTAQARELARDLVSQFRSRGVAREALAALAVLADAIQAEKVTRDLLVRVRRQISMAPRVSNGATSGSAE